FETELQVRPDDLDMNAHVHNSKYFDYVLAARYDQMERCYKMPMQDFISMGLGWVVKTAHVEYKRPLVLGERFVVRTWIEDFMKDGVKVQFEITKKGNGKISCDGWFQFTMVNLKTGRSEDIPKSVKQKYEI
ncbi:MAG: thioesterase family protein, partial [Bacteroidota bacterium]